jgi:hypothetical protein
MPLERLFVTYTGRFLATLVFAIPILLPGSSGFAACNGCHTYPASETRKAAHSDGHLLGRPHVDHDVFDSRDF